MSSRVQKGGQKFRPVAKPRGRLSDGAPRKSSARGSTVDTLRTQSSQPISSSAGAAGITILDSGKLTDNDGPTFCATVDASERRSAAQEMDALRVVPVISPSQSQPVPPATPSQIILEAEPTLRSLLHGNSPDGISAIGFPEASYTPSQVVPNVLQNVIRSEANGTERQAKSSTALDYGRVVENESLPRQHRYRKETADVSLEAGIEGGVEAGQDYRAIESRMTRKRRASAESKRVSERVEVNAQVRIGSEKTPRRTKRITRPTTLRPEGQLDAVSGEESNESNTQGQRKRCRRSTTASSSTPASGRRYRKSSSAAIFDTDAHPGEELDPTVLTMAAICDDTGQGRVSSKAALIQRNHLAWKAANKQKRERMRGVMEVRKYGRKEDENGGSGEPSQPVKETMTDESESQAVVSSGTPAVHDTSGNGFNYKEALLVNRFSARVRIGPNGETIIDEESLFIERSENADEGTDAYQHIEESDQTKFTNSASYGRKLRGSRWSAEETELFFDALSQFGENYELISYVLPGRDRKACKSKFKAEDKKNPNRITYCLNNRIPYDMQTLSRLTGKDFSGPTPEIIAPEVPTLVEEPKGQHSEPEQLARNPRKKSKTSATPDDVEVVGDVETFDSGGPDE